MPAPTTSGQRFTQLIQQLGLTKNAFAQSLGKTATVIQHIVDERNKPGFDLLNRVCEVYPNVASDWLVLGRGPMLREQDPPPLPGEAPAASSSALDGIDLNDIPNAPPRRRNGSLLQPADIAATVALAAHGTGKNGHAPVAATAIVPPVVAPVAAAAELPPVAAAAPAPAPAPAPLAVSASPAAPDPTYLAAALHTVQLQHQLALAEQRNQHLLEQQALLKQLVALLQRPS